MDTEDARLFTISFMGFNVSAVLAAFAGLAYPAWFVLCFVSLFGMLALVLLAVFSWVIGRRGSA